MKRARALLLGATLSLLGIAATESGYRSLERAEGLALAPPDKAERLFVLRDDEQLNEQGFRERKLSLDKPQRMQRVVVLGDSVTFGAGVRIHETWTRQAELLLKDKARVQLVNLAVYSYDVAQIAATMRYDGWAWSPDLVVYAAYTNDHIPTDLLEMEGGPVYVGGTVAPELPALGQSLLPHSALVRRAYGALAARQQGRIRQAEWDGDMGFFEAGLRELALECRAHGVPLMVYGLVPHDAAGGCEGSSACDTALVTSAAMGELAQSLDLPFASALPYLDASGQQAFHLPDSGGLDPAHPSVEGHAVLAEGFADSWLRLREGRDLLDGATTKPR